MNIRRIVSNIIIVSMLLSVIPTAIFAATDDAPGINWNFSKGIDGWAIRAPGEGAKMEHRTSGGVNNSPCLYVTKAQGAGDVLAPFTFDGAKVGDTYLLSAAVKLEGNCPNGKTSSTSKWCSVKGGLLDTKGVTIPADTWTTVTYAVTLTDALIADRVMLRISHPGNTSNYNGGYFIDDYKITKINDASYFPYDKRWEYEEGQVAQTEETEYDNSAAEKLAETVALKTGSSTMFARNNRIELGEGINTIKIDGNIMIPARAVADALTMMVEWNNDDQTAVIYNAYYELTVDVNSQTNFASVFDFTTRETSGTALSVPAQIYNGTLYIPLDAFSNVFKMYSRVTADEVVLISDSAISLTEEEEKKVLNFFTEEIETINFYVSLDGSDENDGSEASPFATLDKAKLAARNYRDKNVLINIKSGEYGITETIKFTKEDSKLGMARTTFKGDGDVILNGGVKARGWEKYADIDGVYRHKLNNPKAYNYIYEDGAMSVQARFPNRDENDVPSSYLILDQEPYTKTGQNATGPRSSFLYNEEDNMPTLKKPEDASVWVWPGGEGGHWRWHFENLGIKEVDTQKRKITLDSQAVYTLGVGCAYYVANDIALLDCPGEFYIDADEGYLYYYPRDVKNLENNIVIPEAGGIISIIGLDSAPVNGIEFENMSIRNTDKADLIFLQGTRNIRIEGCRLYSTGDDAIEINRYARNNIIRNCEIFDTAHRGLYLGETANLAMYNRVENCYVHNVGLIEKDAAGVNITSSRNNTIKNNTLHDGPRMLIALGGAGIPAVIRDENINEVSCRNNLVAFNDVSAGMQESQDGSSFYSFCSYRNVNASNRIHGQEFIDRSKSYHMIGIGIYGDDCTYYIVNRNNLVDNNQIENPSNDITTGVLNHMVLQKGQGSLTENNYLVKGNVLRSIFACDTKSGDGRKHGNYYYNNVAYAGSTARPYADIFAGGGELTLKGTGRNIFYNPDGNYGMAEVMGSLDELKEYKNLELEKGTITEDPKFVDFDNDDFRLRYDSPAYALGTKDINTRDMGVTADFKFGNSDEELKWLYVRFDGDSQDKSFRKMETGQSVGLNVSARTLRGFVANLDNAEINYKSDNDSVASVSADGVVTANSSGVATVTVTVTKDGKTLALPVSVIVNAVVADVQIKNDVTRIVEGEDLKLDYTVFDSTGTVANGADVRFESSNPSVIKISDNGIATAVSQGTAVITVTAVDDKNTVSAKKEFVAVDYDATEIKFFSDYIIKTGGKISYEMRAEKENGSLIEENIAKITVDTDDSNILRVEGDELVGVAAGSASVTASLNYYGKELSVTRNLLVIPSDEEMSDYVALEYINNDGNEDVVFYRKSGGNLLDNGDFSGDMPLLKQNNYVNPDKNTIFNNWWAKRPFNVSVEKTGGIDGSPCIKVIGTGGDADVLQQTEGLEAGIATGKKFIFTAMAKTIDGTATGRFLSIYRHGYTDQAAYWIGTAPVSLSTEWTRVTGVFEYDGAVKGGNGIPDVALRVNGSASGYYLDDVEVYQAID